jgi:hypothetical protein
MNGDRKSDERGLVAPARAWVEAEQERIVAEQAVGAGDESWSASLDRMDAAVIEHLGVPLADLQPGHAIDPALHDDKRCALACERERQALEALKQAARLICSSDL